jgi:hypothetical protein
MTCSTAPETVPQTPADDFTTIVFVRAVERVVDNAIERRDRTILATAAHFGHGRALAALRRLASPTATAATLEDRTAAATTTEPLRSFAVLPGGLGAEDMDATSAANATALPI